jgi:hypothetical protein
MVLIQWAFLCDIMKVTKGSLINKNFKQIVKYFRSSDYYLQLNNMK